MSSISQPDSASRILDITARGIDLVTVLAKISTSTSAGSLIAKEVGGWLGREGLDEFELGFFLESTQALARPNDQPQVRNFIQAVTDRRPKPSVVPLWAQPSGALGRLVASDPRQRWLTTTICCLLRYHDERFIKLALSSLIILASPSEQNKQPLAEYQLAYHPGMLRLEPLVSKIVDSNWTHVANSGIIGSDAECPRLPNELNWACKRGHNLGSHKLAVILNSLRDAPEQVMVQSERLLTNLVLWLVWHFDGRLRIVVSGSIIYDRVLGPASRTVECRVGKFCSESDEGKECASPGTAEASPSFEIFECIGGNLKSLFSGRYDTQQTFMSEPRVRQKLYHSPFRYLQGVQKSLGIQTQRTAQEVLKWYCQLPVERDDMGSRLNFRLLLDPNLDWSGLRVMDLLGRTPALLNAYCGELGRPSVVFSPPPQSAPPAVVDDLMEMADEDYYAMDLEDSDEEGESKEEFEEKPPLLVKYFPILQDLLQQAQLACKCFQCSKGRPLLWDGNCLRHRALMEVMFYFGHGIADAFGAPDASGVGETRAADSGAMAILFDVIRTVRFDPGNLEGTIDWHTLLDTTCQIFLGCRPLETMTDATYNDSTVDVPHPHMHNLGATIVAVQHGDLAVVAPWLDLSQRIDVRRCFRWEHIQGRLGLAAGDDASGKLRLQELARDTCVVETQHTEDVSDYARLFQMPHHPAGAGIQLGRDKSDEIFDFVLVSAGEERYKLLLRVTSESHSRMVDPSRAIIKMARGFRTLRCSHGVKEGVASVPEGHTVELYRFDELLGRWGALRERKSDPEVDEPPSSEEGSHPDASTKAANSSSVQQEAQEGKEKTPKPLRITHILDSAFKFNTALVLAGDNPVFVGSGDSCLKCAVDTAINFPLDSYYNNYGRWIICHDPHPSTKMPRSRLQTSRARSLMQEST